ncbi:MAG TPA: cation:proton antiporter [Mobilitalea sp.]|nr:cation:proton antiporter [Mobilitalea sp.]
MLVVLFFLSNIGSFIFEKLHLPGKIGEIIFGIIAANLIIVELGGWNLLEAVGIIVQTPITPGSEGYDVLMLFAELGVIFLLFSVGLESKVSDLFKVGKSAVFVALLGIAVPFILGLIFMSLTGGNLMASLFIATVLITTSAGVAAQMLKDLDMCNTIEGKIILGAAVISEIVTLVLLSIVSGLAMGDTSSIGIFFTVFKSLLFVVLALVVCIYIMPKVHRMIIRHRRRNQSDWTMLFAGVGVCFVLALAADAMGLSVIIGAYFAGMMFADNAVEWHMIKELEPLKEFFMTFFFISVGIRVILADLASIEVIGFAVVLSLIAILAKYFACSYGAKKGDKSLDPAATKIIGWGMVPKAEVAMVIATIGVMSGALTPVTFSCIVLMTVAATTVSYFMVERGFLKKYKDDPTATCKL